MDFEEFLKESSKRGFREFRITTEEREGKVNFEISPTDRRSLIGRFHLQSGTVQTGYFYEQMELIATDGGRAA